MSVTNAPGSWVAADTIFAGSAQIGFCSCVGYGSEPPGPTYIGDGVEIGSFCVISRGARIQDEVVIDHYCRIGPGSIIGRKSKVLYGAQIFDNVTVGENCIIAGHLIDRTTVEDDVTYSGDMAHLHSDPTADWDTTEEASPIIRRGSVVGVGALIIGCATIGPCAYVGAGEVVRTDIPERTVLLNGVLKPLAAYRGMIKVRC